MGEHDLSPSWPSEEVRSVSDELDLDKWIDGTCGMTRTAKVFQRLDVYAKIEQLREELAVEEQVAKELPKGERGLTDRTAEHIRQEIDELSVVVMDSALTFHVQDRTEMHRETIRIAQAKALKIDPNKIHEASPEDRQTISLHVLADAIVRVERDGKGQDFPDGFPVNKLRTIIERQGDAAMQDVWNAYYKVTSEAPQVSAPLSRRSSSGHGGIT